jgi:hypothetical protein
MKGCCDMPCCNKMKHDMKGDEAHTGADTSDAG